MYMKKILYSALVLIVLVAAAAIIYSRPKAPVKPAGSNTNNASNVIEVSDDADDSEPLPEDLIVIKDGIKLGTGFTVGEAPEGYFKNTLFIGDSRFTGLQTYGRIDGALWFCSTGLGLTTYEKKDINVEGVGTIKLSKLLHRKAYDRIYVCMGINDLGYDMGKLKTRFTDFIEMLKKECPSALIVVVSNLHVGKARSDRDQWVNNTRLNDLNAHLESMQDGKTVFYIETNGLFDNADGDMDTTYTHDNVHILGKYYTVWGEYIKAHAILGSSQTE